MKVLHIDGTWLTAEAAEGETILVTNGSKALNGDYAGHTTVYKIVSLDEIKSTEERQWQESELSRTDNWPTDRPPAEQVMLAYRVALRAYDDQPDFPNGTRPTL